MPHEWWVPVGLTMLGMVAGSGVSIFMSGRAFGGYAKTIENLEATVIVLRGEVEKCVPRTEFQAMQIDMHERRSELDRRISTKVPVAALDHVKENVDRLREDVIREVTEVKANLSKNSEAFGKKLDDVTAALVRLATLRGGGSGV